MSGWDQLLLTDSEKQDEGDRKVTHSERPGVLETGEGKKLNPLGMKPFLFITKEIKLSLKIERKKRGHECVERCFNLSGN